MMIYLGSVYPQVLLEELIRRKQFVDYPANVFQGSLLKGLDEHISNLKVITSPVIKSPYSQVKDLCNRGLFSHKMSGNQNDQYVGTLPIKGVQMVSELFRVYKAVNEELNNSNQKNSLIIYALHSPFLLVAALLRKKLSCSCVVVPDLPEFMTGESGILRRIAKKIDRGIINACLKKIDCFVLLSPYMKDVLPIENKPWTLMEGIYDISSKHEKNEKAGGKVILYTGNLSKRYGIIELLNAFSRIDKDNYRLWICGSGNGEEDVVKYASMDHRIKFFGVVSHDEVLSLQQKATVLINPRSSSGEYTKYSFPSKTMEYLASGTPTIMCHLPAIPEEYNQYIFYITNESSDGIREKILEVCEKTDKELHEIGERASFFIKEKKNAKIQAGKIIELVDDFIKKNKSC